MVPWHFLIAWWLSAAAPVAQAPEPAAARPEAPEPAREIGLSETVEVTGRLGVSKTGPASAPARALGGDDLRNQGARSLPEALARDPAIQATDQVGNGRQLSLDLRGFSGAEGATALIVDGVRVNDPDTNVAAWEMVPLHDVDRVEISPGPRGAFVGGGSLAGVVNVVRRRPSADLQADVRARAGRFGMQDVSALVSGPVLGWKLLASGDAFSDEGFRDDAGSRERSFRLAADRDLAGAVLALDASHVEGRWRQPGALTKPEMDDDPSQAPFNALDAQETAQDFLSARLQRSGKRTDVAAVLGFRDKSGDILATGRSCYGYLTRDSQQSLSLAVEGRTELSHRDDRPVGVRWGVEAARERLHPRGWATDDTCDGEVHDAEPSSAVDLDWDRGAVFAGIEAALPHGLGVEVSARHDLSRVERRGHEMSALGTWDDVAGSRSFGDTTMRAGLGGAADRGRWNLAWRAAWEQSFLAPSAIQLFAYPGFLSNPDLQPQRGSGPSLGLTLRREGLELGLELFRTDVADEIAYDDEALRNVNAGSTRRSGAELRVGWSPLQRVTLRAGVVIVDATYRKGFPEGTRVVAGARVPLVARHRASLQLALGPWRGFGADVSFLHVGPAALSNDFDGSEPELPARRLLSVALRQDVPGARGLSLELAGDNLLDSHSPSRGIESWGERHYTPPMPRTVTLGVAWRFR